MRTLRTSLFFMALLGFIALSGLAQADEPNLVSHWKFDEGSGTIAYDSAGGNHGALVNGPVWTTGQIGGALSFDGIDDYVDCGSAFASVIGSSTKSIMAWVKPRSTSEAARIVTLYRRSDSSSGFALRFANSPAIWSSLYMKSAYSYEWLDSEVPVERGRWTHIALVQDGSKVELYINGVLEKSANNGAAPALSNPPNAVIGAYMWWGHYPSGSLDGTIDDVRIYDRGLSAKEVWAVYLEGLSFYDRAVLITEHVLAEKEEMLDAIDEMLEKEDQAYGALKELLASGDYGDLKKGDIVKARQEVHSAVQHEEQAAGALEKSIDNLYDALFSLGWEPEPEPNLPEPIAHWKFDEGSGTVAYDSAGSNHGALVNGPTWTSGKISDALDFDGVNDYVEVGDPADGSLDFGAGDSFTIGIWFKRISTSDHHCLVSKRKVIGGTHYEGYSWRVDYDDKLYFGIEDNGSKISTIRGNTAITDSGWHHAAVVRDISEDKVYLYLDGVIDTTPVTDISINRCKI